MVLARQIAAVEAAAQWSMRLSDEGRWRGLFFVKLCR